jgi:hypothetical protein
MAAQAFQRDYYQDADTTTSIIRRYAEMQTQEIQDVVSLSTTFLADNGLKLSQEKHGAGRNDRQRYAPAPTGPEGIGRATDLGDSPSAFLKLTLERLLLRRRRTKAWSFCPVRPTTPLDADLAAVVQLLHPDAISIYLAGEIQVRLSPCTSHRQTPRLCRPLRVLHCDKATLPLKAAAYYVRHGWLRPVPEYGGNYHLTATVVKDDTTNKELRWWTWHWKDTANCMTLRQRPLPMRANVAKT